MKRHVGASLCSAVCAVWLTLGVARADKMTDAEELFRRGKALMTDSKFSEACPLFEASERLDPQMGTLLNLAICHEGIGRIATAWGEFRAVEQQARAAGRDDRVKLAHDRAAKLEPRLPRIKIVASADARVPGLAVSVDGEAKGEPLWAGVAVDPGTRNVEVTAPGKKRSTLKVKVDDEGALVTVQLPRLEDALAPPTTEGGVRPGVSDEVYAANRSRRSTGIIVGAAGVVTMIAGGVFGVLAIVKNGDAKSTCPKPCIDGSTPARTADDDTDRALLFANVSNVVVPLGAIAAAIGAYLVLSTGPTERPRAFFSPSRHGGGLGVVW